MALAIRRINSQQNSDFDRRLSELESFYALIDKKHAIVEFSVDGKILNAMKILFVSSDTAGRLSKASTIIS